MLEDPANSHFPQVKDSAGRNQLMRCGTAEAEAARGTGSAASALGSPAGQPGGTPRPRSRRWPRDAGRTREGQACQDARRQSSQEVAVICHPPPRKASLGSCPGPPTLPHALPVLGRTAPALCPGVLTPTLKRTPFAAAPLPGCRPESQGRAAHRPWAGDWEWLCPHVAGSAVLTVVRRSSERLVRSSGWSAVLWGSDAAPP